MTAFITAGAGFLLAVLWFDLMFDAQAARGGNGDLPEAVLSSIAGYYRRVTTAARPMNRLVAIVMVATIVAVIRQIIDDGRPAWIGWTSLALVLGAVALAGSHTVPSAVRLGSRADSSTVQSALARAILRDHVLCISAVAAMLAIQLAPS